MKTEDLVSWAIYAGLALIILAALANVAWRVWTSI